MIATIGRRQSPALVADVCVNGSWISMEVDTGAAVSIVSECTYRRYLHSVKDVYFRKITDKLKTLSIDVPICWEY